MTKDGSLLLIPEWLEGHVTTGRDPLGMQAGSIILYQSLLPGISNITLRARYYSFFSFVIHEYALRFHDTTRERWLQFLRRAELLYALIAANAEEYQTGVAGIEWALRALESNNVERIDFGYGADLSTQGSDRYLKNAGGVFGAAYAGPMFEIGIIRYSDAHFIPIASEHIGVPLAEAFAESIGEAKNLFFEKIDTGLVTRGELDALWMMRPDQIPDGSREQGLLCSTLFAEGMEDSDKQTERRKTLQLMLYVADALSSMPSQDDFRWLCYGGQSPDGEPFQVPDFLNSTLESWWVYQANDLLHIVYERFFSLILTLLAEEPGGVELSIAAAAAARLIAEKFDDVTWGEYLGSIQPSANANSHDDEESDFMLVKAICKRPKNIEDQVASSVHAVRLLAVLMQRISEHSDTLARTYASGAPFGRSELQTLCSEQAFLDEHHNSTLEAMLADLIMKRVIYRHQAIALHKLKTQGDYTFMFEIEDRKATRRLTYEPVFTNPRATNALRFIADLHLISAEGVTDTGRRWMYV